MAARNIRLDLADFFAPDELAGASLSALRALAARLGEVGVTVKRDEIRRGIGADGAKLLPVKPTSRPDGADGKPLDPHYAESRTYRLLAAHVGARGVTLFWRGHGRQSWTTILGYHADGLVRGAPVRDTIGISPAGVRKIKDTIRTYWATVQRTNARRAENLKPRAKPVPPPAPPAPKRVVKMPATPPRPAPAPKPVPSPELVGSGRTVNGVHYVAAGEKRKPRSKVIQVYGTGRRSKAPKMAPAPKPPKPVVPPTPKPKPAPKAKVPTVRPKKVVPAAPAPKPVVPPARVPTRAERARTTIAASADFARQFGVQVDTAGSSAIRQTYGHTEGAGIPAVFRGGTRTIQLNERHPYWQDPQGFMNHAYGRRWLSSDAEDHVIVHELGHALHLESAGFLEYTRAISHLYTRHEIEVAREVSGYAADNPAEFVAEAFAGMRAGKTYSPEVMALYQKFGGPAVPGASP